MIQKNGSTRSASAGTGSRDSAKLLESELLQLRAVCLDLDTLSRAQHQQISGNAPDSGMSLVEIAQQRQVLVDSIDRIRERIGPSLSEPSSGDDRERNGSAQRCGSLLEEIAVLVESVRARDVGDLAELTRRRSDVAKELVSISRGRGAISAYSNPTRGTGGSEAGLVEG